MKKTIVGVLMMLSMLTLGQNCNYKMTGYIYGENQETPLSGVIITDAYHRTYTTNAEGYFEIENLCPGKQDFVLTYPNYKEQHLTEQLTQNKQLTWSMQPKVINLKEVESTATHRKTKVFEQELRKEEIQQYNAQTLGSALKEITGVSGLETGNSIVKPMIHGLHSSRVVLLNNGTRQEDMEWGVEHAPNIDVSSVEKMTIVNGVEALRYGGDAIAGVVLTEHKKLPTDSLWSGNIGLTGITNGRGGIGNVFLQKGFASRWAVQAGVSYRKNGDYEAPRYNLSNTGVEQKSFFVEGGLNKTDQKLIFGYSYFSNKLGILQASHIGSLADLANAINSDEPSYIGDFTYEINKPYQDIKHHLAQVKWQKKIKDKGEIEAKYAFQYNRRKEYDVRRGEVKDTPSMDFELTTHSGEVVFRTLGSKKWKTETGANLAYQVNYANPSTQVKRLIPDYDKYNLGAFASTEFTPNAAWRFLGGIRYDYDFISTKKYFNESYWEEMNYEEFNDHIIGEYGNQYLAKFDLKYHSLSASLGGEYKISPQSSIALTWSRANRAPNPAELFSEGLHHSALSIELGDVRLKQEKSNKWSVNYEQKIYLLHGLKLNMSLYYNKINDFIYQIPTGAEVTIRGAYPQWSYKQINASIAGIDIDADLDILSNLEWKSQLSYLYGQDLTNDLPLINMPPLGWKNEFKYALAKSKLKPHIKLAFDYTAKQHRYPDYNFVLENVVEDGAIVDKLVDISTPPDAYLLVNFSTGITTKIKGNKTDIHLDISNIFNKEYRNYLNRNRYYAANSGRQIQLQITYNF